MDLLKLHLAGYPNRTMKPDEVGRSILVNPGFIVVMTEWIDPAGTLLRIQHIEQDVVVSETVTEIETLIMG